MRVGYLGTVLFGHYSGVERCVAELWRALVEYDRENEYVLYTPRDLPTDRGACVPSSRVRRLPFPGHRRLERFAWEHLVLPGILRREGVDLLHAPAYTAPRTSMPTVLTVYDAIALTHPRFCKLSNRVHFRWALPMSAKTAARVIVPSEATKRELCRAVGVGDEKVRVIPPGISSIIGPISDERALAALRSRFGLSDRVILFVGNLEPKKDVPTLLRAFARLKRRGLPHQLVLAGAKTWLARVVQDAIQRHPARADIRQLGYVSSADLPALYSLAEVFAFPSIVEGFGLPPLEAMTCGTPVVTSDTPALTEAAGGTSLAVPVGDDEALAEAIQRIVEDGKLRADLIARGRARAVEFTWERAARATVAVYQEAHDG